MARAGTILVVDDEPKIVDIVRAYLQREGYHVLVAYAGREALAERPGRVWTRQQLLDRLQGAAFEGYERAIDSHVKNLRHKLEPGAGPPRYVQTVFGIGYKLGDPEDGDRA